MAKSKQGTSNDNVKRVEKDITRHVEKIATKYCFGLKN